MVRTDDQLTRAELAEAAANLRAQGWTHERIGHALGVSRSYASELCLDPDGSKARARKEGYRRPCPECGTPMSGSGGHKTFPARCVECAQAAKVLWTKESVVAAFTEFARVAGRSPSVTDTLSSFSGKLSAVRQEEVLAMRALVRLPIPKRVHELFGTWAAALAAAGLDPQPSGTPGHRVSTPRPSRIRAEVLVALRDGALSSRELAERLGCTQTGVREQLRVLVRSGAVKSEGGEGDRRRVLYVLQNSSTMR